MKRLALALVTLIMLAKPAAFAGASSGDRGGDYPFSAGAASLAAPQNVNAAAYKISGHWTVQPSSIHDDGARTYIQWGPAQSIPAVFGLDERGREELVNGYMRDGSFIIDRIYGRLVFRIDDASASALRKPVRKK